MIFNLENVETRTLKSTLETLKKEPKEDFLDKVIKEINDEIKKRNKQ